MTLEWMRQAIAIVKILRKLGWIEIQRDHLFELAEEIALEINDSASVSFDDLACEIIDVLMDSDFVEELYASDEDLIPIIIGCLKK